MSTPEDYWATRLHAAVDEHPDALAFDVPSYVAAGRRRVRRNRAAAIAATVAAVTVVVAAAAVAGAGMRESAPPPANPGPHVPLLGPGTNGWVAFGARQDGGDIYLVRPGEEARPLEGAASLEAAESCPAWSPDGSRLLFGRASGLSGGTFGKSELVIVPVDGEGAPGTPVVIGLDGFEATEEYEVFPCATWAPDGRWVALAGTEEVWVVDTQTEEIHLLPDLRPSDLEWRPGTDQLAIAGDMGPERNTTSTPVMVYTVSTGELRELGSVEAALVTWSPDGTTLAYTGGEQGDPYAGQLWVADSDGSNQRLLVPDMGLAIHGIGPVWSPTGDRIAYQRCEPDADQSPDFYCTGERHEVVLVSVADGTETVIKPPKTPRGPFYPYTVTWSPDGTTMLYAGWANTETIGEMPDGVIAVPADDPKDLTVLTDAISVPVPSYHDHRWAVAQMWGRESE